jgi:hypothetical protein
MAEYEKKHGDFVLFVARNRKSDKSPSHTGTIFLDGVTYNLAAWEKRSQNGNTFFSGRVGDEYKPPQSSGSQGGGYQSKSSFSKPSAPSDLDDEIPF